MPTKVNAKGQERKTKDDLITEIDRVKRANKVKRAQFENKIKHARSANEMLSNENEKAPKYEIVTLVGWDLSGEDLRGIDLSSISCVNTSFNNITVNDKTKFNNIIVNNCSFDGTKMNNVSFKNSFITDCSFSDTVITSSSFENSTITSSSFENSTITSSHFNRATITKSDFQTTINKSNFKNSNIIDSNFENSNIINSDFDNLQGRDISFDNTQFTHVSFENLNVSKCTFTNIVTNGKEKSNDTNIRADGGNYSMNFTDGTLRDSEFSHHKSKLPSGLDLLNFTGAKLSNTNVKNTKLCRSTFDTVTLEEVDFTSTCVENTSFVDSYVSFPQRNYDRKGCNDTNFNQCKFNRVTFDNIDFEKSVFNTSTILDTKFKNNNFASSSMDFKDSIISKVDFDNISLEKSVFDNSTLNETCFTNNHGSAELEFSDAKIKHVTFKNMPVSVKCCDETELYNIQCDDKVDSGFAYMAEREKNSLIEEEISKGLADEENLKYTPDHIKKEVTEYVNDYKTQFESLLVDMKSALDDKNKIKRRMLNSVSTLEELCYVASMNSSSNVFNRTTRTQSKLIELLNKDVYKTLRDKFCPSYHKLRTRHISNYALTGSSGGNFSWSLDKEDKKNRAHFSFSNYTRKTYMPTAFLSYFRDKKENTSVNSNNNSTLTPLETEIS